jgi:hypothetical protein
LSDPVLIQPVESPLIGQRTTHLWSRTMVAIHGYAVNTADDPPVGLCLNVVFKGVATGPYKTGA